MLIEGAAFVPREALEKLDPSEGIDLGRIYRIVPRSFKTRPLPQLADASTENLVDLLAHRNAWHRETAARLLLERNDVGAISLLVKLARGADSPVARIHALHCLAAQQSLDADVVLSAMDDSHPRVREHAILVSEPLLPSSPELRERLHQLVSETDARLRYQLAFSLGALHDPRRNRSLARLVRRDPKQRLLLMAVQSSATREAGDLFLRLTKDSDSSKHPLVRELLADLAAQIGTQGKTTDIAAVLSGLAAFSSRDPQQTRIIQQRLFSAISKDRLASLDDAAAASAMFGKLLDDAKQIALDETKPLPGRVQAARTLGLDDFDQVEVQELFARMLRADQPVPIQLAACETLARFDHPKVADLLLRAWPRMTPNLRRCAVETMFTREEWLDRCLDAIESGLVKASELDAARIRLVETQTSEKRRARLGRLFASHQLARRQSVIDRYQAALRRPGDKDRGKQVFLRACAACHKHEGIGKAVGPELRGTQRRPAESLLVDILDPDRASKPQFQNYVIRDTDGRILTGMIIAETANSVTLQKADGSEQKVLRLQIETLQSTGVSFMPDGIEKTIDVRAMAGLLAFLGYSGMPD